MSSIKLTGEAAIRWADARRASATVAATGTSFSITVVDAIEALVKKTYPDSFKITTKKKSCSEDQYQSPNQNQQQSTPQLMHLHLLKIVRTLVDLIIHDEIELDPKTSPSKVRIWEIAVKIRDILIEANINQN